MYERAERLCFLTLFAILHGLKHGCSVCGGLANHRGTAGILGSAIPSRPAADFRAHAWARESCIKTVPLVEVSGPLSQGKCWHDLSPARECNARSFAISTAHSWRINMGPTIRMTELSYFHLLHDRSPWFRHMALVSNLQCPCMLRFLLSPSLRLPCARPVAHANAACKCKLQQHFGVRVASPGIYLTMHHLSSYRP